MDPLEQYAQVAAELEDFWGRRAAQPRYSRETAVFGYPVELLSNDEALLAALEDSARQFSQAETQAVRPLQVRLIVQGTPGALEPLPEDLTARAAYTGAGDWLMMRLGPWGSAFVDLARGEATAVLSPELAARPDLVSQALLNTILVNLCVHHGYGQLQAALLVRDGRALLLLAPQDEDTAALALQLVLGGFRLVSDRTVHISPFGAGALLGGYPVGTMTLREETLARFPQVHAHLRGARGDKTRFVLDLRRYDPRLVVDKAWPAGVIEICLVGHHAEERTTIFPAGDDEVWDAVLRSSLYYDETAVWQRNLARIAPLVARARAHHLMLGQDTADVLVAINRLWET